MVLNNLIFCRQYILTFLLRQYDTTDLIATEYAPIQLGAIQFITLVDERIKWLLKDAPIKRTPTAPTDILDFNIVGKCG